MTIMINTLHFKGLEKQKKYWRTYYNHLLINQV